MRSLIILCALFLGAPAWAITADDALILAEQSVSRASARDPSTYDVTVLCKSAGHGSFRMMVSQSCGGSDRYTANIWIINQSDAFWINEESSSELACGYADDEFFAYFDTSKEVRKAKNLLAKYCKDQLTLY